MEMSEARLDPAPGQIVAGRYLLLSLCGKGGMGGVWRARHLPDESECAVKILHHTAPNRIPRLAERFMREARVASSIDSPNAVRVLDYGVDSGLPFIAMELLEGETLAARLRRSGRMTALETLAIVDQVTKALACAHEMGVVHRDLKPDNIFLSGSSDGSVVAKVLDFGIAKILDEETISRDLTETGALLGTPHYMSPEQIDGARYVDHRADLWSLAVIAFECITGRRPFQGDGLRALVLAICVHERPSASALCEVPVGFDAWFAVCASRDPGKRHRSAAELAEELRKACNGILAPSDRAPTEVDTTASDDESGSMELVAGSMAVPRVAAKNQPSLADPEGSEQRLGRGASNSPVRPSRLPSSWAWGIAAFLVLAFSAWVSVSGILPTPARNSYPLAPPRDSSANEPPVSLPAVSARVDTSARGATASDSSSDPKPETPKPRIAPALRVRSPPGPKPAAPSSPHSLDSASPADPVPSAQPVPSAEPVQTDFDEMLKDRK